MVQRRLYLHLPHTLPLGDIRGPHDGETFRGPPVAPACLGTVAHAPFPAGLPKVGGQRPPSRTRPRPPRAHRRRSYVAGVSPLPTGTPVDLAQRRKGGHFAGCRLRDRTSVRQAGSMSAAPTRKHAATSKVPALDSGISIMASVLGST
jgi:hypothetical protein